MHVFVGWNDPTDGWRWVRRMRPDVLSDQELEGALERAALGVDGWTDEALAPQPPSEEAT